MTADPHITTIVVKKTKFKKRFCKDRLSNQEGQEVPTATMAKIDGG